MSCSEFSLNSMTKSLNAIQTDIICRICNESYPKKWCKGPLCFYCKNFLPHRDTRYSILKDIEWYFIKSGEDNRYTFYNEYINYLNKWCTHFQISYLKEEMSLEIELRNIQEL